MGVKSVINAANTTAPIAAATDEYRYRTAFEILLSNFGRVAIEKP